MKTLLLIPIILLNLTVASAQIVPNCKAKFSNVDYVKVSVDKQGKQLLQLTSSDLANSEAEVSTSEDGKYTYFRFYSSILDGEGVMIIQSAKKIQDGSSFMYVATCKELSNDKESTWLFDFDSSGKFISVSDHLPNDKLWLIRFNKPKD